MNIDRAVFLALATSLAAVACSNESPDTSAPGHTSHTCRQVPPSICTNAATSQNGTSTDTNGS